MCPAPQTLFPCYFALSLQFRFSSWDDEILSLSCAAHEFIRANEEEILKLFIVEVGIPVSGDLKSEIAKNGYYK